MKICCDRCEKGIKVNIFDDLINGESLIVRRTVLPDKKLSLCEDCYGEFKKFMNGGDV